MKSVKHGGGITEREVVELDFHESIEVLGQAVDRMEARLGRAPDYFDWTAGASEEWAVGVLRQANGEPAEPDSAPDFARRMLELIAQARYEIGKGDAARAAHYGVRLGEVVASAKIKRVWEETALMGKAHREGQSERGKSGGEKRWASPERAEVDRLIERLSDSVEYEDWTAREKWAELIGRMDRARLNPVENWVEKDCDKSTIEYNNGGRLTYKTFKNRV